VRTDAPQGFFPFLRSKEEVMPRLNPARAARTTGTVNPRPAIADLAEGCLRRNPYLALKNVACDCRDGVLVLRGCLPSYYLKQVAQEAVARLEGVKAIDNQIQILSPASRSGRG
jgi:hypothetical protein